METNSGDSSLTAKAARILVWIIIAMAFVIICGTIFALLTRPSGSAASQGTGGQSRVDGSTRTATESTFTGIGRIRAQTSGPVPATVVLGVAFPYYPEDKAFSEELASRVAEFRAETLNYFLSYVVDELRMKKEEDIKRDLLQRYNSLLRLGSIQVLYFNDFMIID